MGNYDHEAPLLRNEAIGKRLLLTRRAVGMAQRSFAEAASIANNTYNQYETGKNRPAIDNAIRLCHAFDLTLDWIYRGDPSGLRFQLGQAIAALLAVDGENQIKTRPPLGGQK
jgi:transcriptional regulator with XRE-family HTH domain